MAENTTDRLKITGGFLIFLTVVAIYAPFWKSSLVYYQDNILMHLLGEWNNGHISLMEVISGRAASANGFGPLSMLTFMLDSKLFGLESGLFHIPGIMLHGFTCLLMFYTLIRLRFQVETSFWTVLIFSLHPMHSIAVGWLQARGELLAGFFAAAAILVFTEYIRSKKLWPIAIAGVLAFFAILANERMILLPVLFFLYILSREKIKENLLALMTIAVILSGPIVSYSLFRLILKNPASPTNVVGMNLFTNAHVIPETLGRFFVPAEIPILPQFNAVFTITGVIILAGMVFAGIYLYRSNKVITFFAGILWFVGFMIPGLLAWMKIGEVSIYSLSTSYVALLGLILPLASMFEMLQELLGKYFPLPVIGVTVVFLALTVFNGTRYLNGDNYWKAVTLEQPDNIEVYRGRFIFLLETGKTKEAAQLAKSVMQSFDAVDAELGWFVQSFESKELFAEAEALLIKYKHEVLNEELYHTLIRNLIYCGDIDLLPKYIKNKRFSKATLISHLDSYITYWRSKGKLELSQKLIIGKSVIERIE